MELRRRITKDIIDWYQHTSKALLVRGARQVGKTYSIRSALKELKVPYVEINLIEHPAAVRALESFMTVDELVMMLSTFTSEPITKGRTVIFIDEVQRYADMVSRIKFLVDEGSFRYILSGSLLGVELTNLDSAPVGYLKILDMYPLDFEEFLQVSNISSEIREHLFTCFQERKPVNSVIHEKMLSLFGQYLVVGGMPEAVDRFTATHNLNDVMTVHKDIIDLYKLDFTQYETKDKRLIISHIYDLVPAELLKQNRRFIVTDLQKGLHFERVQSSFLWLERAGVVLSTYNATEPRIPLKLNEQQSRFKLYLSDVGLLTSIYGMGTKRMILGKEPNLNGGGIYENAICQQLTANGLFTYYYNSNRLGELDFIIEYQGRACPIEVKSGKDYKLHSALDHVLENAGYAIPEAFVFANGNIERKEKVTYLPVYMAMFLKNEREDVTVDMIDFTT